MRSAFGRGLRPELGARVLERRLTRGVFLEQQAGSEADVSMGVPSEQLEQRAGEARARRQGLREGRSTDERQGRREDTHPMAPTKPLTALWWAAMVE